MSNLGKFFIKYSHSDVAGLFSSAADSAEDKCGNIKTVFALISAGFQWLAMYAALGIIYMFELLVECSSSTVTTDKNHHSEFIDVPNVLFGLVANVFIFDWEHLYL